MPFSWSKASVKMSTLHGVIRTKGQFYQFHNSSFEYSVPERKLLTELSPHESRS